MVEHAAPFAYTKRRRTLVNLNHPELEVCPAPVEILTEREKLLAKIPTALQKGAHFPLAGKRTRNNREEARQKVVDCIAALILECNFPAAGIFAASHDPGRLFVRLGAGKRTATLKNKLNVFKKLKKYFLGTVGVPFPGSATQLMDYLLDRSEEPCGPTVPASILSTVRFFEEIGGVDSARKLSANHLVLNLVSELRIELAADNPQTLRKANQLPWVIVAIWEIDIASQGTPDWKKILIWAELVQVWGAFRVNDSLNAPPKLMSLELNGLVGTITSSKTTGKGKKIHDIKFFVSKGAFLVNPDWLEQGWKLYRTLDNDRTCLVPLLNESGTSFSTKEPSYVDCENVRRKLILDIKVPQVTYTNSLGWETGSVDILCPGMQMFWAGHSARATVPTWAAACGVPKEQVDRLGRWKPSESAEYVRTLKPLVFATQNFIAEQIRIAEEDRFEQRSLLEQINAFGVGRELDDVSVWRALKNLNEAQGVCAATKGKKPAWSCPKDGVAPKQAAEIFDDADSTEGDGERPYQIEVGSWVVSRKRNGKARTLHRVGNCWREPGKHYAHFEVLSEAEIESADQRDCKFNAICKDCFKDCGGSSCSDGSSFDDSVLESESESSS
jgi:hypothetical protein